MPVIEGKEIVGILHSHCTQRAFDAIRPNHGILIGVGFGKNSDRGRREEEEAIEELHLEEQGSRWCCRDSHQMLHINLYEILEYTTFR